VVLEALGRANAGSEGLVGVTDLAAYIDAKVPEISDAVFKMRQVPQMSIVGSNFLLVRKTMVLSGGSAEPVVAAPAKPSHVIVAAAWVRESPRAGAAVIVELSPGTQVQLVETKDGWVLVARDGKKLGYLQEKELVRLQ
jgi:hypothetical protein